MYRIANDNDLFVGRPVIPCHNKSTAEFYVKQWNKMEYVEDDWEEYPTGGNYFVIYDSSQD